MNSARLHYNRMLLYCQVKNRIIRYILLMITNSEIQKRLREAIKASTLSQKEIALKLNLHPTTINKYLKEDVYPSLETFANLCEVLDVSSDEILGLK